MSSEGGTPSSSSLPTTSASAPPASSTSSSSSSSSSLPSSSTSSVVAEAVKSNVVVQEAQNEHHKAVVEAWVAFDLDGRRSGLDRQCLELKDAREAAQRSRKMLAESTKEFRKMSDTEKLATVSSLVKSYQGEIDALTKRARASDGAAEEDIMKITLNPDV